MFIIIIIMLLKKKKYCGEEGEGGTETVMFIIGSGFTSHESCVLFDGGKRGVYTLTSPSSSHGFSHNLYPDKLAPYQLHHSQSRHQYFRAKVSFHIFLGVNLYIYIYRISVSPYSPLFLSSSLWCFVLLPTLYIYIWVCVCTSICLRRLFLRQ